TVKYDIETVKGFKNVLFGGEGLFLSVVEGPGRVWLQTVSASEFAKRLMPFMPSKG
ncbi:MAG TPA: AIM24 family protein, partial [Anaerolineaceae bacterium]|nr:AIM24 family protein [Anaerolineaceae bacterium]